MRTLRKIKIFDWIAPLLIGPMLIIGFTQNIWFVLVCAVCADFFWLMQLRLTILLRKDETIQKKRLRFHGFFLLLPAAGIIASGISLISLPFSMTKLPLTYLLIGISAVLFICQLIQMIANKKETSPAARFLRLTLVAAMSAPSSLALTLTLYAAEPNDAAILSCMSVGIFGTGAFLIAVNMIIISLCEYQSTKDSLKTLSSLAREKKLVFTRVTILKDAFLVAAKTAISIISLSFFMFANALYSVGMGVARFCAVRMHTKDKAKQLRYYRCVGLIISAASICYIVYSVRLFGGGKTEPYSMYVALLIALYTFVEFGINIRETIRLRKSHALQAKAMRAISLASTLLCFVLTQTAIMSFASEGNNSFSNALAGLVFGVLATLVGFYIVADSFLQQKIPKSS